MLAELSVCLAAFEVIKQTCAAGKDIISCGEQAAKYFDNKSQIQRKVNAGGTLKHNNDYEEFAALQKLQKMEMEWKEILIYEGDPGAYNAFLKFQADCRRRREAAEKAELARKIARQKKLVDIFQAFFIAVFGITGLVVAVTILIWIFF